MRDEKRRKGDKIKKGMEIGDEKNGEGGKNQIHDCTTRKKRMTPKDQMSKAAGLYIGDFSFNSGG